MKVYIRNLKTSACIGVHEWERRSRQPLILHLELEYDAELAAENDDIQYAVDYDELSQLLAKMVDDSDYRLVETLADRIVTRVLKNSRISWVKLDIEKPNAVEFAQISVSLERRNS